MSIKKIAEATGLSKTTVSMILNKKDSPLSFSAATRERVMKAAREINYRPNYLARSLSTGKRYSIGIAGGAMDVMDNPSIGRIYSGIGRVVREHDNNMVFFPVTPDIADQVVLNAARSRMVDGLVIFIFSYQYAYYTEAVIPQIMETGMPVVALSSVSLPFACPHVGFDAEKAGFMVASHLVSAGAERVGFVGISGRVYHDQLYKGYARALAARGLGEYDCRITGMYDDSLPAGREHAAGIVEQHGQLDAYVVFSDFFATGFVQGLEAEGIRVPDDVLVTGIDDAYNSAYYGSGLTTVSRKFEERGAAAAEMLFGMVEKPETAGQVRPVIFAPELVKRGSTARHA